MRKTVLFFLIIFLVIGVYGCMKNQNVEAKMEDLENYASNKYGREFTIINFQAAKDETYTNILTLSDGEYIFNIYQSGDNKASDDYPQSVVNQKMINYLKDDINYEYDIFANFMFTNGNEMSLEYVEESIASTILSDYSLLKIVIIIRVDSGISEHSDSLYNIYKEAMNLNPKYIDFEVIQTDDMSIDLKDMLNNLPAYYENEWNKYPEIEEYLCISDTNITSAIELIKGNE